MINPIGGSTGRYARLGDIVTASVKEATPDGTVMGHVHLHVADLTSSEAFYVGDLGLDVTVRSYPGALGTAFRGSMASSR